MSKKAIIIGAGPAGLTAAYELLKRTDIIPIVLEKSGDIGGISKTVNYKGNRIDIGGHRFFSKSDRVMQWWMQMMPVQTTGKESFNIHYRNRSHEINTEGYSTGASMEKDPDKVMLVRKRLSRIYFLRKFFAYPIRLSFDTLSKLGVGTTIAILFSYLLAQLFPCRPERNLEDFMINRFGKALYNLFFKDYTEKVWGRACNTISAEWGAQRIKGISISKALHHAIQEIIKGKRTADIAQKDTETSLIEQFLYPKFGPGQLWEEVATQVEAMGGKIMRNQDVKQIYAAENSKAINAIATVNSITGETDYLKGNYFFSTMPVQELIAGLEGRVPADVREVAEGLQYRDFITVGILLKNLSVQDKRTGAWQPLELKDTWIYIQEKEVKVGRLQLFNNWSPFMVKDPDTVWVGMEFFCNKTDDFWQMPDIAIQKLAIEELEKIGLADSTNVLDAMVLRMEKTYPAYFGTYERFDVVRNYVDRFQNLFLVGRNGMHKYNNSDHSMLTAMVAVDNICAGITDKANIWAINTEQDYHEEKQVVEKAPEKLVGKVSGLWNYIFREPANRWYVWIGVIAILLQLAVFKYFYPFAGFINGDSYAYLESAHWNYTINTYPIGYSRFLRLFSVFTYSDTALVIFQYCLLQGSIMAFIFTMFKLYTPGRLVKNILFAFMLFNPVFLYLANYVSSDALFLSLSLIWFTQLLWIMHKPTRRLMLLNGLVLCLVFMVRYNALFYPCIAAIAYLLSRQKMWIKLSGWAFGIILIGLFMNYTSNRYYLLAGTKQFSPFTGWQMANNAMYAYRYVDSAHVKPVPARFQQLDKMVRTYFDTTRDVIKFPQEMVKASTVYMWDASSPLQRYKEQQFKKDSTVYEIQKWATVGPLYKDYGVYLIKEYPITFAQYYLWPNALKYYAPPVEFLEKYSTGVDSVHPIAKMWFDYKSNKLSTRVKDYRVHVLDFYPVLTGVINVVFLLGMISFFLLQLHKKYKWLVNPFLLTSGLWMINFGFSVVASPVALRFQLFPILISFSFACMSIACLFREVAAEQPIRQIDAAGVKLA